MGRGGDVLARGAKSAQFVAGGNNTEPAELKNLSSEPRTDFVPVEIDRTRKVKAIRPKGDMLWVRRREAENISAGGLHIPTDAKDAPAEGTVISIGPNVKDIVENDHVIFGRYSGTEYPWGGETLLFMREDEVIATVED